jgi:hypothetical protein
MICDLPKYDHSQLLNLSFTDFFEKKKKSKFQKQKGKRIGHFYDLHVEDARLRKFSNTAHNKINNNRCSFRLYTLIFVQNQGKPAGRKATFFISLFAQSQYRQYANWNKQKKKLFPILNSTQWL